MSETPINLFPRPLIHEIFGIDLTNIIHSFYNAPLKCLYTVELDEFTLEVNLFLDPLYENKKSHINVLYTEGSTEIELRNYEIDSDIMETCDFVLDVDIYMEWAPDFHMFLGNQTVPKCAETQTTLLGDVHTIAQHPHTRGNLLTQYLKFNPKMLKMIDSIEFREFIPELIWNVRDHLSFHTFENLSLYAKIQTSVLRHRTKDCLLVLFTNKMISRDFMIYDPQDDTYNFYENDLEFDELPDCDTLKGPTDTPLPLFLFPELFAMLNNNQSHKFVDPINSEFLGYCNALLGDSFESKVYLFDVHSSQNYFAQFIIEDFILSHREYYDMYFIE